MIWLQENWWIAAIVAVILIVLAAILLRRPKIDALDIADHLDSKAAAKAAPKPKPLEPVKPEIIAAEPARFKPLEPVAPIAPSAPVAPVATPAPAAPPPAPKPAPVVPSPVEAPTVPTAPTTLAEPAIPAPAAAPAVSATESAAAPAPAPTAPSAGDNLRLMKGVGPKLVTMLHSMGITRFAQIAAWTDADIARIDPQLGAFQGRITRDNWIDQASYLAKADKAGFEAKYGALGGEL